MLDIRPALGRHRIQAGVEKPRLIQGRRDDAEAKVGTRVGHAGSLAQTRESVTSDAPIDAPEPLRWIETAPNLSFSTHWDGAFVASGDHETRRAARRALAEAAERGELRLPDAVRAMRRALDLNQQEFGRLFKLTRRQISELENAAGDPKLSTLTRIARVFGMGVGFVPTSTPPRGE
ncbi:MAG: helix-turn-helix transcriptional regulator [Alphaproteobacteria bacterium]|nr:helix-turn-helix transcriptional regulator [Alphaproteobacteria bacterium]